jgi:regulator of replication initiation timing
MTDNLFLKLEERMMVLVSEIEELRNQIQRLTGENAAYKAEKESNIKKLQDLISLVDSVNAMDNTMAFAGAQGQKPVLVHGMD